jgi:hypothetical protein
MVARKEGGRQRQDTRCYLYLFTSCNKGSTKGPDQGLFYTLLAELPLSLPESSSSPEKSSVRSSTSKPELFSPSAMSFALEGELATTAMEVAGSNSGRMCVFNAARTLAKSTAWMLVRSWRPWSCGTFFKTWLTNESSPYKCGHQYDTKLLGRLKSTYRLSGRGHPPGQRENKTAFGSIESSFAELNLPMKRVQIIHSIQPGGRLTEPSTSPSTALAPAWKPL